MIIFVALGYFLQFTSQTRRFITLALGFSSFDSECLSLNGSLNKVQVQTFRLARNILVVNLNFTKWPCKLVNNNNNANMGSRKKNSKPKFFMCVYKNIGHYRYGWHILDLQNRSEWHDRLGWLLVIRSTWYGLIRTSIDQIIISTYVNETPAV